MLAHALRVKQTGLRERYIMKRCALGNAAACCIGEAVARHAVVTQAPAFVKQAPQEDSAVAKGVRLTEERLPDSRVRVTVEVPVQDVRTAYERGLQLARKRLELPGFRKGKKASSHSLFIYFASTLVPLCDIGSQEGAASLPQVALGLMTAAITHGCMRRAHGCAAALRQATLCAWVQRVPGMRRCQSPCWCGTWAARPRRTAPPSSSCSRPPCPRRARLVPKRPRSPMHLPHASCIPLSTAYCNGESQGFCHRCGTLSWPFDCVCLLSMKEPAEGGAARRAVYNYC